MYMYCICTIYIYIFVMYCICIYVVMQLMCKGACAHINTYSTTVYVCAPH